MSERFEVGETEKHLITVGWSIFSKRIRIERDGEVILDEMHFSPAARTFEFDIEGSEPHHILVIVGGFHSTELHVDGRMVPPLR